MTNETRERIRAYKKLLPDMRERVLGVALLLITSVAMMVTASFAWITLSRAPEVTGMQTTVAANGNLEIALATGTTAQSPKPEASKVGDSSAAAGQTITGANITWGNLINLSDPSYGLDALVLRPARLNTTALLTSPLYGAKYKTDGRVEQLNSSFGYGTWDKENREFIISNDLGVRAISSVTIKAVGFAAQVQERRDKAEGLNQEAGQMYLKITDNSAYMDTLATVMGTFMTANMNSGDAELSNQKIEAKDVNNLKLIFEDFIKVYDKQFEAMAALANYQLFLLNNNENESIDFTPKTAENIKAATETSLASEGVKIDGLDTAKKDYNKILTGHADMQKLQETGGTVKWKDSNLTTIVSNLMDVGKCEVEGKPVSSIGASQAAEMLQGTKNATITNGVLYNFEYLNGAHCDVKGLSITAKKKALGMAIPATVSANITTTAPKDTSQFAESLVYADSLNNGAPGEKVANDTYGLALDLWVRTNAHNSYLTLEGNVLTKTETVPATGTDRQGNKVNLYTLTRVITGEDEAGNEVKDEQTVSLYKVENGTNGATWYTMTHEVFALEEGETPTQKMEEKSVVIGYEGENRVWEDKESHVELSLDSTTQGSGSCYVYYADTPEDQARSLELLKAMKVAFVSDKGKLLASASMDTEKYYAESGRVTVPLKLDATTSLKIGTNDITGESIYGITYLTQNQPMRITAIVYLEGDNLENEDVLAASNIQGQLNIQFGSSVDLQNMNDEKLINATRRVSAEVSETEFEYDGNSKYTTVTVRVEGDRPNEVKAFFIRQISSTQGSREALVEFEEQEDGTWTYDYEFKAPGTYVLRSVQLDGQTYDLVDCPKVIVDGFAIESLECVGVPSRYFEFMSAESFKTVDLKLKFAATDINAMPKTVQGRYLRESDGVAVNVNFTYNTAGSDAGFWTGQATFNGSGKYVLTYLVLDGEYSELDENLQQTALLYLGMRVEVYTTSPLTFLYKEAELTPNQRNLQMQVVIKDNTGTELPNLQNVRLYYQREGSGLRQMDAQLVWDGSTYYRGTFLSEVGVFRFKEMTVGTDSITIAEKAPVFRIMSPNPPSYDINDLFAEDDDYEYRPGGEITMDIKLKNASTATVMAEIENIGSGTVYEVYGSTKQTDPLMVIAEEGDEESLADTWSFLIPKTSDNRQDGNWRMNKVYIWDFYTEAGQHIDSKEHAGCIEIPVTGYVKKAVSTVYTTVTDANQISGSTFGKTGDNITGAFMQGYTISGLSVNICDFEDEAISAVDRVEISYVYAGNSSEYGGYSGVAATDANFTVVLRAEQGKTIFKQTENKDVRFAGKYNLLSVDYYTTGEETHPINHGLKAFEIYSVTPTVQIDKAYYKTQNENDSSASEVTGGVETTVYHQNLGGTEICGTGLTTNYTSAYVDIKLSGYGNASAVQLKFTTNNSDGKTHLYPESNKNKGEDKGRVDYYEWSADGSCRRYVGWVEQKESATDPKAGAGTLKATELYMNYGGKTYTVDIPDITINNPS